jgi:hypothetical protein
MRTSRENPDAPEVDVDTISEQAEVSSRRGRGPSIAYGKLTDAAGENVDKSEAITERQAAQLLGFPASTLGRHRAAGRVNPALLLTESSQLALPGEWRGKPVWYKRSLVEALSTDDTTEPLFV